VKQRYLEVMYRKGKPLAAYLYLPRSASAKVVRTEDGGAGMRVDFDPNDVPIGVEITAPGKITAEHFNQLLQRLGQPPLPIDEWTPLHAA
jgi:hypothetical protein